MLLNGFLLLLPMKVLLLAAGYATRLYPLTENQPKPLLEINGQSIIGHILDKVKSLPEVSEVFIVTNHRFYDQFRVWSNHFPFPKKITLIDDGTLSNTDRLGAVGDINFVLRERDIKEDLLVIAGDNLFGFSLRSFLNFYNADRKSVVALKDLRDPEKIKGRYGVGLLEGRKVIAFEEKPVRPRSTLAATACYLFTKNDLSLVEKSIYQGKADNPGDLVKYLVKESEVHGFVFNEHWFDVGSFESLREAEELYGKRVAVR